MLSPPMKSSVVPRASPTARPRSAPMARSRRFSRAPGAWNLRPLVEDGAEQPGRDVLDRRSRRPLSQQRAAALQEAGEVRALARLRDAQLDGAGPRLPDPVAVDHRRAVPVLNVGRLRLKDQAAPVRVDHDLTLAALHLLVSIVASRARRITSWTSPPAASLPEVRLSQVCSRQYRAEDRCRPRQRVVSTADRSSLLQRTARLRPTSRREAPPSGAKILSQR
jgi:hypothetical protein